MRGIYGTTILSQLFEVPLEQTLDYARGAKKLPRIFTQPIVKNTLA